VLASCSTDRTINIYEEQVGNKNSQRSWKKVGCLVDSRDAVQDVQFAPRHHGLKLASCSLDGRVRIYEAPDPMNLAVWHLLEEFEAAKKDCFCLSWNSSPFDPPMLVVASENSVKVWEYNQKFQKWQAVVELEGHEDNVHDVAWAPNMGRTYHLIATACKDQYVRIYKLKPSANKPGSYDVQLVAKLGHHKAEVWRVAWNVTGTMLASTGDDGTARLWKADFAKGEWHHTLVASGQNAADASADAKENKESF